MSSNTVNTHKITVEKKDGLTQTLLKFVKSNPNSIMSDGKITL